MTRAALRSVAGWFVAMGAVSFVLGGCVKSQKPTLAITSARVAGESAEIDLLVRNPSDYDLHLREVIYVLELGRVPVSRGVWETDTELPKGGVVTLTGLFPFEGEQAADASAGYVELRGMLVVYPKGATSVQSVTDTDFTVAAPVER